MNDLSHDPIPLYDAEDEKGGEYVDLPPGCAIVFAFVTVAIIVLAGVGLCTWLGL